MLTFMLSCWELNSSTSCRMTGPSPPVNPFQNARSTFGPLYALPLPALWPCCTAGLLCGPPPQPASTNPAPAPALRSKKSCRVSLRPNARPLSTFPPSAAPVPLPSDFDPIDPLYTQSNSGEITGQQRSRQPSAISRDIG